MVGKKVTELTLEDVKQYLRVEFEEDDNLLTTMLVSAQSFIQSYLNKRFDEFEVLPDEFTIACLALISHWYEKREIQSEGSRLQSELPYIFSGLLDLHRNWN